MSTERFWEPHGLSEIDAMLDVSQRRSDRRRAKAQLWNDERPWRVGVYLLALLILAVLSGIVFSIVTSIAT